MKLAVAVTGPLGSKIGNLGVLTETPNARRIPLLRIGRRRGVGRGGLGTRPSSCAVFFFLNVATVARCSTFKKPNESEVHTKGRLEVEWVGLGLF